MKTKQTRRKKEIKRQRNGQIHTLTPGYTDQRFAANEDRFEKAYVRGCGQHGRLRGGSALALHNWPVETEALKNCI